MFFTTAPKVPFNTEIEGLRLFPKWKMVYPDGSDILIQPLAEAGIPEYVEYWNRLMKDPKLRKELRVPKVGMHIFTNFRKILNFNVICKGKYDVSTTETGIFFIRCRRLHDTHLQRLRKVIGKSPISRD